MRAAVTTDDGAFEVTTVDDPSPDGELLLRVSACGLCGSDLKARPAMPARAIMGHEFGGEVVEVGPRTEGWTEGMHAAVLPVASCGSCGLCRSGDVVHCACRPCCSVSAGVRAASPSSRWCRRPRRSCYASPSIRSTPRSSSPMRWVSTPSVRWESGRGMPCWWSERARSGSPAPRGPACAGPGGSPWSIPTRRRRAGAGSFGATDTLSSAAEAEPGGYDVAIECVGKPGLLDACIAAARPKGRIVVAGVCTEQDPFWSIGRAHEGADHPLRRVLHPRRVQGRDRGVRLGCDRAGTPGGADDGARRLAEAFDLLAEGSTPGKILVAPG